MGTCERKRQVPPPKEWESRAYREGWWAYQKERECTIRTTQLQLEALKNSPCRHLYGVRSASQLPPHYSVLAREGKRMSKGVPTPASRDCLSRFPFPSFSLYKREREALIKVSHIFLHKFVWRFDTHPLAYSHSREFYSLILSTPYSFVPTRVLT